MFGVAARLPFRDNEKEKWHFGTLDSSELFKFCVMMCDHCPYHIMAIARNNLKMNLLWPEMQIMDVCKSKIQNKNLKSSPGAAGGPL